MGKGKQGHQLLEHTNIIDQLDFEGGLVFTLQESIENSGERLLLECCSKLHDTLQWLCKASLSFGHNKDVCPNLLQ